MKNSVEENILDIASLLNEILKIRSHFTILHIGKVPRLLNLTEGRERQVNRTETFPSSLFGHLHSSPAIEKRLPRQHDIGRPSPLGNFDAVLDHRKRRVYVAGPTIWRDRLRGIVR